jgi:glycosyltransferase involved in cell wall biosynthesis
MNDIAAGAAFLVDPFNATSIREGILSIINDRRMREDKIRLGLQVVANYSPENVAKRYSQVYHEVFQNSGK